MQRAPAVLLAAIGFAAAAAGARGGDALAAGFADPPPESRPGIWWFWGESVTTDHGITEDLESLKRVGFGSTVIYEQVFTDRPDALKSLSPEWLARVRFAAAESARLGLTLKVNVSDGYVAGGPWITPDLGMQRLVASEWVVQGGRRIEAVLPRPEAKLGYYRDVAVIAYPAPAGAGPDRLPVPVRTVSPAGPDLDRLFGGPSAPKVRISPPRGGGPVLVQLDYGRAVTARSLTYSLRPNSKALVIATQVPTSWADDAYGQNMRLNPPIGRLEASSDGRHWLRIRELPAIGYQQDTWDLQTVAFPATTARYFRLNLQGWGHNGPANDDDLVIGNVELRGEARVDQWERKSGNVVDFSDPDLTPGYSGAEVIDPDRIVDLTARLGPGGRLAWDAPPGWWTILRLGHTPTGAMTKHGRPENLGLECDKLSAAAARVQFQHYVGAVLREVRRVPGARLAGVSIDSAEHGSQNWTPDFEAQFLRRRGYDPRRFLPAMMGRVVGSPALSDRFLFDVRRTIADLMSDAYYGTFLQLCHSEGMTLEAEAPGIATCLPSDNIQAKGRTDIPMGEFWANQPDGTMDCKEAACAAHVYGLPVAAAESFTGSRAETDPATMKPLADAALALGINQFMVLAYIHQPWDDRLPGVTQDRFYVPFQRHNTWWEDGRSFWTTLARSSYLMRRGHPVMDLLYDLGDDTPLKIATWRMRPAPPAGYDYDVCGDEVLLTRARAEGGRIVLPDGMSYRMLVLAGGPRMTLAAARRVQALVVAGATVLGPDRPIGSPSLADGPAGDAEVRRIGELLWGAGKLPERGVKDTGAGQMLWGWSPAEALARLGTGPDFAPLDLPRGSAVRYAHRRTADGDIYFLANPLPAPARFTGAFRTLSRIPEFWDPQSGAMTSAPGWRTVGPTTQIPIALEPGASLFVVFRDPDVAPLSGPPNPATGLVEDMRVLRKLPGPWSVRFAPGWGAPVRTTMPVLASWTESADPGIRHYSGPATYSTDLDLGALPYGRRLVLDLGGVEVLAGLTVNGRNLGIAWKAPYAFDVTSALRAGRNTIEIRVVNLWVNRLIADSGLPKSQRKTWVTWNPFHPGDPLLPSGLLGPVLLRDAGAEALSR